MSSGPIPADRNRPSVARMYDYYLGGKDNFAVDREAVARILAVAPTAAQIARANRVFLVNAVRFMAESGVRQFIDLGTGIPTSPNVHEVARAVDPRTSVVYVDNDPVVMSHTRARLARVPGVIALHHDVRESETLLRDPRLRALIDFDQPVGVLCVALLHFIDLAHTPGLVHRFRDLMVPGSHLAISVVSSSHLDSGPACEIQSVYSGSTNALVYRTREQVEDLFDGFDLVEPGLVDVNLWRTGTAREDIGAVVILAGVGRRP